MKWKGLLVLGCILILVSVGRATIPTRCEGNNYDGSSGGFHRFSWMRWPDPIFPQVTYEYHHDRTSWRFTAAESATIAALQLYSSTPGGKTGQYDPQLTISIQTDDGSGKPTGTVLGSYTSTYPLGKQSSPGGYSGPITAPLSVSLTAGTVYHMVTVCDSLTTYSWSPLMGGGADYANSAYDFRLNSSDSATVLDDLSQRRTYDGTEDTDLLGLYYNHISSSPYENQWVEGTHEATDEHPDGNEDEGAKKRPLFEMFATYDSQTQTVSNPIANLAQGYRSGYPTAGYSKGRPVNGPEDAVGEKLVAHYPTANPVAKKARVLLRKDVAGAASDPDGTLTLEVRDNTNTVLATGTVLSTEIPFDGQYTWAVAKLNTDVALIDGQTYYVSVRSPDITQGTYRIGTHQGDAELFPSKYNSYYGIEAVLVEDDATSGDTWTETDTRDLSFGLAIIIPGDANGDGIVNVGDLGIMGANWPIPPPFPPYGWGDGDFNGDGIINVGDLGILGAHYGEYLTRWFDLPSCPTPEAGGSSIPEPTTISLLVIGSLVLLRRSSARVTRRRFR